MTPIGLMDSLKDRLQLLLTDYSSNQPSGTLPVQVHSGYLPIRNNAGEKNSFVYILAFSGTDTKEMGAVKVEFGFSIYDDDKVDGWRSLFNVMEHVRQDLLKNRLVDMEYRLEFPLEFKVADDQPFPQWQGTIVATYTIAQPVEEGFNYDDYQETKTTYGDYSR
jgi:hypothetical protein|nr:MAG TPA: tail completion protein [Caudoviricetes sp.]